MKPRSRPGRLGIVSCAIGVLIGGVMLVGSMGVASAAISATDCDVVVDTGSDVDQGSSSSNVKRLAEKAVNLGEAADGVSNKKLKKAFLRIAAVYKAAGKAKDARAAQTVIVEKIKDLGKGLKVFFKLSRTCSS
jgi:hypothetical protein